MPSNYFQLLGAYGAIPSVREPSGDPGLSTLIDERMQLARKHYDELALTADAFQAVSLGGLSGVNVLVLKVVGEKVVVRLTSADGTQQTFPVEEFLALTSISTPLTAIDVQRVAGVTTTVKVFLGEKL